MTENERKELAEFNREADLDNRYYEAQSRKTQYWKTTFNQVMTIIENAKVAGQKSVEINIGFPNCHQASAMERSLKSKKYSVIMKKPEDSNIHHSDFDHIYSTKISWK